MEKEKVLGLISKSLVKICEEKGLELEEVMLVNSEFMRRNYKRSIIAEHYYNLFYDETILLPSLEATKRYYRRFG